MRELVRAGERVRPARRYADDRETLMAELVGELRRVAGEVQQRPAGQRVGVAEAGARDHDVADVELERDGLQLGAAALRGADRAVQVEHEAAVARAGFCELQAPAVTQADETRMDGSEHESEVPPAI